MSWLSKTITIEGLSQDGPFQINMISRSYECVNQAMSNNGQGLGKPILAWYGG
jgi:hypothetical protein